MAPLHNHHWTASDGSCHKGVESQAGGATSSIQLVTATLGFGEWSSAFEKTKSAARRHSGFTTWKSNHAMRSL